MRLFVSLLYLLSITTASAQVVSRMSFDVSRNMGNLYVDPDGTLFISEGFTGDEFFRVTDDGDLVPFADGLSGGPLHMTLGTDGNYYAPTFNDGVVYRITPDGTTSVFATLAAGTADIVADAAGTLYISQYGNPITAGGRSISRVFPDGTDDDFARGGSLRDPVGMDFDDEGNLYVANFFDGRIIKITPDGTQTLFASLPQIPGGFTIGHLIWSNDRLYATYLDGHQVYAFDPDGTGRVLAGTGQRGSQDGPAATATFNRPNGIAASVTGDSLFISEFGSPRDYVRVIDLSATTSSESGSEAPAAAPESLSLDSVYPTPFEDTTTLSLSLRTAAEVTLTIYDSLGREVERRAIGYRAVGAHTIEWRPNNLPAGVYILRIGTGNAHSARSVVYHQ